MTEPLRCAKCGLPYATMQNGAIVIESRHHGEKHINVVSVWELVMMVLKSCVDRSTPDE